MTAPRDRTWISVLFCVGIAGLVAGYMLRGDDATRKPHAPSGVRQHELADVPADGGVPTVDGEGSTAGLEDPASTEPLDRRVSVVQGRAAGEGGAAEADRSSTEAGAGIAPASPLDRLLAPWFKGPLETLVAQVGDQGLSDSERLKAARMILIHDIAVAMERAGTALPMRREGASGPAFPSRPKFYKDGRAYCFEEVEFPMWIEVNTYLGEDGITPPPGFWTEVRQIGASVIANLLPE